MVARRADTAEIAPTVSAARIDDRLRAFIASAPAGATAAEITRQVGDLAWTLGLTRPSYQRVRLLLAERRPRNRTTSTPAPAVAHYAVRAVDFLYQYPGPGMQQWYAGYARGAGS